MVGVTADPRRALPSVEALVADSAVRALAELAAPRYIATVARLVVASARAVLANDPDAAPPTHAVLVDQIVASAHQRWQPSLRPLYNGTGVLIHTNLGRAPLAPQALAAMTAVAVGYSTLEYDVAEGRRGSRHAHLGSLLRDLTGAADGVVVNNNAAALVVVLAALARGREVILSRGQSVEIGGGFRIPDIMRQSGVRLIEVGTTNRTRIADYAAAITPRTAALLRVHTSNFVQQGFVEQTPLAEMVTLARQHNLPVIDDLGSGCLLDVTPYGLAREPLVQDSVQAGASLICFSGDKLLGGPQAGLIVGDQSSIKTVRSHSLVRAMRVDKMTLAGLHATLSYYLRGDAVQHLPIWRMIAASPESLAVRALAWANALASRLATATTTPGGLLLRIGVQPGHSPIGGGALPGQMLPTSLLTLSFWRGGRPIGRWAGEAAALLRHARPGLVVRVEDAALFCDPRAVLPEDDAAVLAILLDRMGGGQIALKAVELV